MISSPFLSVLQSFCISSLPRNREATGCITYANWLAGVGFVHVNETRQLVTEGLNSVLTDLELFSRPTSFYKNLKECIIFFR